MRIALNTCTTFCLATACSATAAVVIGGAFAIINTPALALNKNNPEEQNKILTSFAVMTLGAAVVGAGVGALVAKVANAAFEKPLFKNLITHQQERA